MYITIIDIVIILIVYFCIKNYRDNKEHKEKKEPEYIYDCGVKLENPFYKPDTEKNQTIQSTKKEEE